MAISAGEDARRPVLATTGSRDRVQAIVLAYRAGLVEHADLLRIRS